MSFIDRLFKRKLTQDAFAKFIIKRLRASGETGSIDYDAAEFRLQKPADHNFFLHNFYQQYLRSPKVEHENLIHNFLTTWHTSGFKAPEEFADAKPDLLPALRARSYLEIGIPRMSDNYRGKLDLAHQVVAEHLIETLVYDMPQSMMSVNDELLEKWGVAYYEAMEVAKENLRAKPFQFAQAGEMYAVVSGDGYDATRMLLLGFIRKLKVRGDTIAMVPNRETLYVGGSDDAAGLEMMAKLTKENVQLERSISGLAFRLVGDEWEVWMPPEGHPSFRDFRELYIQSIGQNYAEQKDLLDRRHELEQTDIFVASYSAMEEERTGKLISYCVWSDGVDTLLPETDQVFFFRPEAPIAEQTAGNADWDTVRRVAGDLMESQGTYPERWRVKEFPDAFVLREICRP
jgi:hypothetical protein